MIQVLFRVVKRLLLSLRRRTILIYAGVYVILLWTVSSLLFHHFEGISLFDALYWAVTTTTTVGYGDITPQTPEGRAIAMFVMLSGIGILGVFLGTTAEILIEHGMKRKKRVDMEEHIVAVGWDRKVEIAVKELLKENVEVAVVANVEELPFDHKNLEFVKGNPTDEENLIRAGIEKAKYILVSGKDDMETLLVAIAAKRLNDKAQITCVVSDSRVMKALENIGVDQVLSIDEFSGLVLCRSVFSPRLSVFLNELMSTRGMDIYEEKIEEFVGKNAGEVLLEMRRKHNAIFVGVVRNGDVIINPPNDFVIEEGDEIVYIAERKI
jgi:voltage-gated potassium channel